jgi:ABC-type amino acid transport substrate-binding protein
MKKLLALTLVALMCFVLFAACTPNDDPYNSPELPAADVSPDVTPDANTDDSANTDSIEAEPIVSKWFVIPEALATEEYAIGFRKEDVALTNLVNDTLIAMKSDGTLGSISEEWFGKDVTTIPSASRQPREVSADDTSATRTRLTLGLDASFPPMGYTNEVGDIVGFDIDVALEVCARNNWELILQAIDWDAKELELNGGNIDCIWNGMTKTEARDESMSLSLPYMNNEQVVVVLVDSGITTLGELAGKRLVLQAGSSAEDALNDSPEFKAGLAEVNTMADNMTAFMDGEIGGSDAILLDSVVANWYIVNGN